MAYRVGQETLLVEVAHARTGKCNGDLQSDHCAEPVAIVPKVDTIGNEPEDSQDVIRNAERGGGRRVGLVPDDREAGRSEHDRRIEGRGSDIQRQVVRQRGCN